MSRLSFMKKQSVETWGQLHRRIYQMDPPLCEHIFPPATAAFLKKHATAMCSSEGFLFTSMLAATSYLIGDTSWLKKPVGESLKKPNLFFIVIGPPGTGKSQAINAGATEPLSDIAKERADNADILISRTTSAGLLHHLSTHGKGMLVSGEIYDILYKLIKCDNDLGTGDTTLFCELYSGELASMNYATQKRKSVSPNTPFCVMGASQPRPAFELLMLMAEKSNGIHHRFLFYAPQCFRPSYTEITTAADQVKELPSVTRVLKVVEEVHATEKVYTFEENCQDWLRGMFDEQAEKLNEDIREGRPTTESKVTDQIERVAVSLHVLISVTEKLLSGEPLHTHTQIISLDVMQAAAKFVEVCEGQKEIILKVKYYNHH